MYVSMITVILLQIAYIAISSNITFHPLSDTTVAIYFHVEAFL